MKLLPPVILVLTASVGYADNLHVDVNCADYWATPDSGLDVRVDGVPAQNGEVNSALGVAYTKHGNPYLTVVPTDIGFNIAPGTHRVTIGAPGCAALDTQLSLGLMPSFVSGRLPISDDSLAGATGAPNGLGILLGGYSAWRGAHTETDGLGNTTYAWDGIQTTGGVLSMSYDHRNLELAYDMMIGTASGTGTSTSTAFGGGPSSPSPFTANVLELGNQLRIGYRVPEKTVAFAAGSGVGGGADIVTSGLIGGGSGFDFYVPLWASLTVKPSCDWGVQVLASYDVHPTSMNENAPALIAGVQWQPTAACSEQAGLAVR